MNIRVDKILCTNCGICKTHCGFGALMFESNIPVFNNLCVFCGACVNVCPVDAITITRREVEKDNSDYRGVMTFIEKERGAIKPVALEIMGAARQLADRLGESCSAVVLGPGRNADQTLLTRYGAKKIYAVKAELLKSYNTEIYTNVMTGILASYKPSIVLFGATHLGRDLAPRVAARLDAGLTADCTGLDVDSNGNLLQMRPTFGGDIIATIITPHHRPQMATVRPRVMKSVYQPVQVKKPAELITINVDIDPRSMRLRLLDEVIEVSPFASVEEADYIVSGGRGMGKKANFRLLEELVQTIAAHVGESRVALGASRAAVDEGWIPHQHQVGQTGKTVTPKLYIACGISGQIQHLMGMRESEKVIAVNKDRNAPIFRMADFGLVGDVEDMLPHLIKFLKREG